MFLHDLGHSNFVNQAVGAELELNWEYQIKGAIMSSPVVTQKMVYFGGEDGIFYALKREDGEVVWSFPTQGSIFSSPAFEKGTIFVGSKDGNLYALDSSRGQLKWKYSSGGIILSSPLIYQDQVFIGVGYPEKKIIALDKKTGQKEWEIKTEQTVYSSPAAQENLLFCGACDGTLYGIDLVERKIKWEFSTGGNIYFSSPGINEEVIYCLPGNFKKSFYALQLDGTLKWEFKAGEGEILALVSSPAFTREIVYFQSGYFKTRLYALSAQTGQLIWQKEVGRPTGYGVLSTPLITKHYLYLGGGDGFLYVFAREDGEKIAEYDLGAPIVASPVIAEEKLYVATSEGKFFSFLLSKLKIKSEILPERTEIEFNFPNPFNPEVWIPFSLAEKKLSQVKIKIYNLLGQLVREISLKNKKAGFYRGREKAIYWDGRDSQGKELASGVYFYQYEVNGEMKGIKKSLLLK
jgi:outer membrane protein assembly factor BamB